jgi:hypothetical protein
MKLNARGLAGTVALAALVGVAGCVTVNAPNTPNTGASPRPSASASAASGSNTGNGTTSPAPTASAAAAFKCETPEAVTLTAGNTDFDKAQTISACATLTASFSGDEQRFFKVVVPAGAYDGHLKVTIDESSADYSPEVRFFSGSKTELGVEYADDATSTPMVAQQAVTAGKTYYVRINQPADATELKVRVAFEPVVDMNERNDTFETAKALTSGTPISLISFAGVETLEGDDEDFFKIEVPAGKTTIALKIDNKSTGDEAQSHEVRLYKANKEELDAAYSANAQADLEESFTVEAAGTYYLKVKANAASAVASQLTVTVQ